jgi:hypothetical protein
MKTFSRRFVLVGMLSVLAGVAVATVVYPPVQYGQQCRIYFTLYDSNSPWRSYMTVPAATDVNVVKDGGTGANATNSVARVGRQCSLLLTATEMQAACVCVEVNDADSPKLYMDETIVIPTFGNASAFIEPNTLATYFTNPPAAADGNGRSPGELQHVSSGANIPVAGVDIPSLTTRMEISKASKDGIVTAADANGFSQYWTQALATALAVTNGRVTANVATAVVLAADLADLKHGISDANSAIAALLAGTFILQTGTVASYSAGTRSVTLSADFVNTAGWYVPGSWIILTDADTGKSAFNIIAKYSAGRVAQLAWDPPFTPAASDPVNILMGYGK